MTVCVAAVPLLWITLRPSGLIARLTAPASFTVQRPSSAARSSLKSQMSRTWERGISSVWPSVAGSGGKNATTESVRNTSRVSSSSRATISQNGQLGSVGGVVGIVDPRSQVVVAVVVHPVVGRVATGQGIGPLVIGVIVPVLDVVYVDAEDAVPPRDALVDLVPHPAAGGSLRPDEHRRSEE